MAQALDLPGTATQDPALSRAGVARNDVAASVLFARRRWHSRSRPLQSTQRTGHPLTARRRGIRTRREGSAVLRDGCSIWGQISGAGNAGLLSAVPRGLHTLTDFHSWTVRQRLFNLDRETSFLNTDLNTDRIYRNVSMQAKSLGLNISPLSDCRP